VDRRPLLEAVANIDARGIDPYQLLITPQEPFKETLAKAKKRTGLSSTDYVKTERNRARKRKRAQQLRGFTSPPPR
jgi:hypothetical protein